jgi:hypothetical protein
MVLAKRAQPAPRPASSSTSKRRTASDALDDADPAIELTGVPPQSQQHQQQRPRVRKKRRLSDSSDEAYQPPSELMEEEVEAVGSVAETRQQAYAAGAGGAGSSFAPLEASGAEADEDARLLRAWCDEARRLQPVPLALRQYLRRNRLRRTLQISFAPPSAAAAAMHPHHAAAAAAATSLQFLQPPQSQQQPPPHAGLVQPSTNPFMLRAPTSTGLPSAMPAGAASKPLTMSSASGQSLALAQQAQQLARKPGGQFASLERKLGPSSDVMPIMQQRRIMQELQAQGGMYGPEAGRYYGAPVPAALKPVAITQSTTLRSPAAPAPSVSYAKQPPLPYASPTPPAPAPAPAYSKPAPADTKVRPSVVARLPLCLRSLPTQALARRKG